jgi:pSer/pThr/pTyr-binding forkhead associated (FHA) protein
MLTIRDNSPYIKDTNSTNGVYVNNEIIQECNLKSGDKIQIGKYLLLLTEVGK